nr:MAG TPA: hypothetical protein [Caudoviricetes sp.]
MTGCHEAALVGRLLCSRHCFYFSHLERDSLRNCQSEHLFFIFVI